MTKLSNYFCYYKQHVTQLAHILFKTIIMLVHRKNHLSIIPKVLRITREDGLLGLRAAFFQNVNINLSYTSWVIIHDTLKKKDRKEIRSQGPHLQWRPIISILLPTHNASERWLQKAIESVRSQLYPYWELCIAYDASADQNVISILREYERLDKRIKIEYREQRAHICAALNSALGLAQGEFVAIMSQNDELPQHALYMFAAVLNDKSHLDLIYSDEDKIDEKGQRFDPYFKPDWNPVLFIGQNIINHLSLYRTKVVREAGGFREGYEGAQDWDLALRISERIPSSHIHHIPFILYHNRAVKNANATEPFKKSFSVSTATKALCEHLQRTGSEGTVISIEDEYFRIRYAVPSPEPLVSIIIPTRNGLHILRRCVESILGKTCYPNYEILIVDNQSDEPNTLNYLRSLEAHGLARIIKYNFPFNYSAINNFAVDAADGSYLCLMNNDVEVISEDWLNEMLSFACKPEIGAVGAMLYYPNNTIQHAGVLLGMGGVAGHLYLNEPRGSKGYKRHAQLCQYLSAVTAACLVIKTSVYREVGGLDEKNLPVAFNDVDFCLRIEDYGYRNLWTPFAELYHHEYATRGHDDTIEKKQQFKQDYTYMLSRWGYRLKNDPAYNPNLTLNEHFPNLALTPRITKPWQRQRLA
jgi:glycosyltransferase involved in cell wall biosynthesis